MHICVTFTNILYIPLLNWFWYVLYLYKSFHQHSMFSKTGFYYSIHNYSKYKYLALGNNVSLPHFLLGVLSYSFSSISVLVSEQLEQQTILIVCLWKCLNCFNLYIIYAGICMYFNNKKMFWLLLYFIWGFFFFASTFFFFAIVNPINYPFIYTNEKFWIDKNENVKY